MQPVAPSRLPGPRLSVSLAVGALGLVLGIVSVVFIALPFVGAFTSPEYTVPGEFVVHLHHARYTIYERNDYATGAINPGNVAVSGPDGQPVEVRYDDQSETLTRGSARYDSSLTFDAPSAGTYDLKFTNVAPTSVVVARSILDALRSVAAWFGVGALGAVLLLGGLVMLIVGVTRRGRARRAPYGWGPPPGAWPGSGPGGQWGSPPAWGTGAGAPYPGAAGWPPPGAPPPPPGGPPPGYPPAAPPPAAPPPSPPPGENS